MHEARERAPRDFVRDAALRDDVAPHLALLSGNPEHLVLEPAERRLAPRSRATASGPRGKSTTQEPGSM